MGDNSTEVHDGIVVVGSGAAGMHAALGAAQHADVIMFTDRAFGRSNSVHAQGGLQRPHDTDASRKLMVADIERSAREPINKGRIEAITLQAAQVVDRLRDWGMPFDMTADGAYVRHLAGGLSDARIISAGDRIGSILLRTLGDRIRDHPRIDVRAWSSVVDLHHEQPATWTAQVVPRDTGRYAITTPAIVVATGGSSYGHAKQAGLLTTNPENENHSMTAVLSNLGIEKPTHNRFQFHPYGIVSAGGGTTVRGVPERITRLGIRLLDRYGSEIAAPQADRLEIVSRYEQVAAQGDLVERDGVHGALLSLSDLPWATIENQFPAFARWAAGRGIDAEDPIVQPVVHYQLDGFVVDRRGATGLQGLFLAGEITGGIHGANRLMGMGLTQSLVDGWIAGDEAGRVATSLRV